MLRLWNRLVGMDNNRLTKQIFMNDFNRNRNNSWCSEIKFIHVFDKIGLPAIFQIKKNYVTLPVVRKFFLKISAPNGQIKLKMYRN